ncbi:ABC transporter permease [Roseomonas stagni]|uniref:ABC transporter permease n=1 Tax=Falsiroseomonas algicola TaxID=2716930 RepID=A0A6M1LMG5_9PROT|nr:ABC transporter permease [Falsiroseomonas algicola]NGM21413.1 ABC transporter permease [Falsiroseomonas algicola]
MSVTADGGQALPSRPQGLARIRKGFRIQGRVIHALALRELTTRFGRNQLGFVWLVLEPLMLATMVALLHWLFRHDAGGPIPVFMLYVIGYAPYFAFRAIVNRACSAFHANMTLMYHRQVRLTDVVVARNLLEACAVTAALVLVIGSAAWLVDMVPANIPLIVLGLVLIFLFANGLAMLAAAGAARWEVVDRIVHPMTYLMLPISGAFTPAARLPPSWREILLWNPQANMHEMVREGMFGDLIVSHYYLFYTVSCVLVVNMLGLAALRAVRPKLEF